MSDTVAPDPGNAFIGFLIGILVDFGLLVVTVGFASPIIGLLQLAGSALPAEAAAQHGEGTHRRGSRRVLAECNV